MSTDVPSIPRESTDLLQNRWALAINADPLGRMPFRFAIDAARGVHFWRKELVGGAVVVVVANMSPLNISGGIISLNLLQAGFSSETRLLSSTYFRLQTKAGIALNMC